MVLTHGGNLYALSKIDQMTIERTPGRSKRSLEKEVKKHNYVDDLIVKGYYSRGPIESNYGYFIDVVHQSGKSLVYPESNTLIDRLFIGSGDLAPGKEYLFEAELATSKEREKRGNPFFLKAKDSNISEILELTDIQQTIKDKESQLVGLQSRTLELDSLLEDGQKSIQTQISQLKKEEEAKLAVVLSAVQLNITHKEQELAEQSRVVQETLDLIHKTENQLVELNDQKVAMENTITFLKQKITVCQNLEFLSEQDINKYLHTLGDEPFCPGEQYLDFEQDFQLNYSVLATHIQHFLYHKKNLLYTKFQIENFLALLMTHDLIVLSGLSGSGKTQIVKAFAEALGGVAKIIPVKPNWTSSEDLLGYYNPIQSTFSPTPFTEAIVEAIQNPHQIYLICLDEMNLARVEYYFADFLSKMEERSKQPEIDLYARHEEELFIAEFKTLLTLIESATGENTVTSWHDFLKNDSIRNRFFELIGNTEKESLLQIHSKMRRRLIDILKFPATIKIPNNVRFIGAINVDETTHYFSPKILDRIHMVKFENPLLIEEVVINRISESGYDTELRPVYLRPEYLGERTELPSLDSNSLISKELKPLNKEFLLPLSIDFGVRSIRQSINYASQLIQKFHDGYHPFESIDCITNSIINQKILPRFIFDGNEIIPATGEKKIECLERLAAYLQKQLVFLEDKHDEYEIGQRSYDCLLKMINGAKFSNGQINYYI